MATKIQIPYSGIKSVRSTEQFVLDSGIKAGIDVAAKVPQS